MNPSHHQPFISDYAETTDLEVGAFYAPAAELHFEMRDSRDPDAGLVLMGWLYGDLRIDRDMAVIALSRAHVEAMEAHATEAWLPGYLRLAEEYQHPEVAA